MTTKEIAQNYYEHQSRHNPDFKTWFDDKNVFATNVFCAAYTLCRINMLLQKHRCEVVTIDRISKAEHPWHNHYRYFIATMRRKKSVIVSISFPYQYSPFGIEELPWDAAEVTISIT